MTFAHHLPNNSKSPRQSIRTSAVDVDCIDRGLVQSFSYIPVTQFAREVSKLIGVITSTTVLAKNICSTSLTSCGLKRTQPAMFISLEPFIIFIETRVSYS